MQVKRLFCSEGGTRTRDTTIMSRVLEQAFPVGLGTRDVGRR